MGTRSDFAASVRAAGVKSDSVMMRPRSWVLRPPLSSRTTRYYGPDGRQRSKTFERKTDAERFLAAQQVSQAQGEWIDPNLGKLTVAEWSQKWFPTTAALKPKTRAGYESR